MYKTVFTFWKLCEYRCTLREVYKLDKMYVIHIKIYKYVYNMY